MRVWYTSLVAWNLPLGSKFAKIRMLYLQKGRCISGEKVYSTFVVGVIDVTGVVVVIVVLVCSSITWTCWSIFTSWLKYLVVVYMSWNPREIDETGQTIKSFLDSMDKLDNPGLDRLQRNMLETIDERLGDVRS